MSSKRFKKLPENTKTLKSETIDKLIPQIKKIAQQSSMNQLI